MSKRVPLQWEGGRAALNRVCKSRTHVHRIRPQFLGSNERFSNRAVGGFHGTFGRDSAISEHFGLHLVWQLHANKPVQPAWTPATFPLSFPTSDFAHVNTLYPGQCLLRGASKMG